MCLIRKQTYKESEDIKYFPLKSVFVLADGVIVNLDVSPNRSTHWVAYTEKSHIVHYFNSLRISTPPTINFVPLKTIIKRTVGICAWNCSIITADPILQQTIINFVLALKGRSSRKKRLSFWKIPMKLVKLKIISYVYLEWNITKTFRIFSRWNLRTTLSIVKFLLSIS